MIWALEITPASSSAFSETFEDGLVHGPKDMMTDKEISLKSGELEPPSLKPVERYLDIDDPPSDMYRALVSEINQCFHSQSYSATIVLTRKLIENLLVDILRKKYGMSEIELFYIPAKRRFQDLSELIANLRSKIEDFGALGLQKKHITMIEKLREEANAKTHSILDHATREELQSLKASARNATKMLIAVRDSLFRGT